MKFAPPGAEPYRTVTRIDGWVGNDPTHLPNSVAVKIAAAMPSLRGPSEIDRIRARMTVRQLRYERSKKIRIAWRWRFGLLTRSDGSTVES